MTDALVPTTKADAQDKARDDIARAIARLDRVALLMDDQFELPIVKRRIGLDPVIGLIPGGGDWVVWFVSVYIFWEAMRLGAPAKLLLRMAANIGVDLLGGYVPVVGDLFDAAFKANRRNVELVRELFGAPKKLGTKVPQELDPVALAKRDEARVQRAALALLMTLALLAVASGPLLLLYFLLH
ncbi:MAG: DUF4112 domain-containing protein [Myxococcota bacterium]